MHKIKFLELLALTAPAVASAKYIDLEDAIDLEDITAYGYLSKIGAPAADRIRKSEEQEDAYVRIVGGSNSNVGQFPHQAGLLVSFPGGQSVCGGSLIRANRVLTAAHCWFDGQNQGSSITVVLGSIHLFSGGTRVTTNSRSILMRSDDMKNVTVTVSSLCECEKLNEHLKFFVNTYDPMWRETVTGCMILELLRDMYKFNVSYVYDNLPRNVTINGESLSNLSRDPNTSADVFVRSMSLTIDLLDHVYPVFAVHTWRMGFLLSRTDNEFFTTFYSKPFSRPVWNCLYAMAFLISFIFYFLKRWEFSVLGGWQSSYVYESLMVIGAYCQHIPPIDPKLPSRRIAYLIFFVFAYIVYTYYTSNLLSHLVNDKEHDIDLDTLANSDYECVIVDYLMLAVVERWNMGAHSSEQSHATPVVSGSKYYDFQDNNRNFSILLSKLMSLKPVTVRDGLDAVKKGRVAVLSDYTTIYPYIRKTYDNDDICKLVSIDLASKIKKYFYTSKNFKYKDQFKIGTLRIKEAGILNRIVSTDFEEPKCTRSHLIQIRLSQISIPLTVLACIHVICLLILVAERIYFKRNVVWPYVD